MEGTRVYTKLGDYQDEDLRIHQLEYQGGISQLFSLKLVFSINATSFQPDELIGQASEIEIILNSSAPYYIKGVIQDCSVQDTMDALKQQQYHCIIVPKLAFLQNQPENYLYRDQPLFDLILFLLTGYTEQTTTFEPGYRKKGVYDYQGFLNINDDCEVCFLLSHPQDSQQYPTFGQLLQYQQSAYDFLAQLLALNGLSYFFDHSKSQMPLVIADCIHDDSFRHPLEVNFEQAQQTDRLTTVVYQHSIAQSLSVGQTIVRGYNPDQSSAIIRAVQDSTVNTARKKSAFQAPIIASSPAEAENLSLFYQGHFDATSQVSPIKGQGFVYPGQLIKIDHAPLKRANHTVYITKLSWVLTMDSSAFNEIRTCNWQGQCVDNQYPYYALPKPFDAPTSLRGWQVETVVSGEQDLSDNDYNTLDQNGRYCISPPKNFNKLGGHKQCLLGLRLLQTFHSEDHKQASPLAQGTHVSLSFEAGNLQRPFIDGTLNSAEHPVLTDTANSQNMVWQDEKFNRLSFLSTGAFIPFSADGHQSATELYAPNYDGAGSFAGLRIGDAVSSSQLGASEPGIHWETSGKWREIHEDSHVEMFGMLQPTNAKEQPTIPVYRLFTQLTPSEDYPYHRIENITPDEILRTFNIGGGNEGSATSIISKQDKTTVTQSFKAKQHHININNDETIYVYQNLQESYVPGEQVDATVHEHKVNTLNEKHLTQNHIVNITADSLYEYYKASHIEKHLHKNNIYSATNITFNEVIHNTTTTGLNISADETVYNAAVINQVATGTNTVTATKSMTQKGAVLNQVGQTHVNVATNPKEIKFEPNTKAILTVSIQDRFAKTPEDKSCFGSKLQSARLKVIYSQQNTQTQENTLQHEMVTVNRYGVAYLYHLGTQDEPLLKEDVPYITQQIKIIFLDLGYVDLGAAGNVQEVYITHINQEPILFDAIKDIETKAVAINAAKRSSHKVIIKNNDWTKNPPRAFQPAGMGDIEVKGIQEYRLGLGVLEPTMYFNFRQDNCLGTITPEELNVYKTLAPYFGTTAKAITAQQKIAAQNNLNLAVDVTDFTHSLPRFTPEQIACLKKNGNNVTLFIHGYNSKPGCYPDTIASVPAVVNAGMFPDNQKSDVLLVDSNYKSTLGWTVEEAKVLQDYEQQFAEDRIKNEQGQTYDQSALDLSDQVLFGDQSFAWQIQLQTNLNMAAGFTGEDYTDFTRVVLIQWMGDPAAPDYMAATVSSDFAATRVFKLIQQLQQEGISINLIAHSLGNEVLIRTLDKVGKAGLKPVDHVFMWDAAIPDTSFNTTPKKYLAMVINDKPLDYGYNFPDAQKGVSKVTVLYSPLDNILGPIQLSQPLYAVNNQYEIKKHQQAGTLYQPITFDNAIKGCLNNIGVLLKRQVDMEPVEKGFWSEQLASLQNAYDSVIPEALEVYADNGNYFNSIANDELLEVGWHKMQDPAAGLTFVLTSMPFAILDPLFKRYLGDHVSLKSIYNLANLFVYPFSWIIESKDNMETLYKQFVEDFGLFEFQGEQTNHIHTFELAPTLDEQTIQLRQLVGVSELYNEVGKFIDTIRNWAYGAGILTLGALDYFSPTFVQAKSGLAQAENLYESFLTLFLSGLMISPMQPATALGYGGVDPKSEFYAKNISSKLFQSGQFNPEEPSKIFKEHGTPQCVDHCAMSFPASSGMNNWVYAGQLFGVVDGTGFDFFGNYSISKARATNSQYARTGTDTGITDKGSGL